MASRTISLDQSAYDRLSAAKRPGESFSQVVKRLTKRRQASLLDLVGAIPSESAEELDQIIKKNRDEQAQIEQERRRRLWSKE